MHKETYNFKSLVIKKDVVQMKFLIGSKDSKLPVIIKQNHSCYIFPIIRMYWNVCLISLPIGFSLSVGFEDGTGPKGSTTGRSLSSRSRWSFLPPVCF
jgi:hypothetical protein